MTEAAQDKAPTMASIANKLSSDITPAERRSLPPLALKHQQRYENREQWFTFIKACLPYTLSALTLVAGVGLTVNGHENAGLSLLTSAGIAGGGTVGVSRVLDARKAKAAQGAGEAPTN